MAEKQKREVIIDGVRYRSKVAYAVHLLETKQAKSRSDAARQAGVSPACVTQAYSKKVVKAPKVTEEPKSIIESIDEEIVDTGIEIDEAARIAAEKDMAESN